MILGHEFCQGDGSLVPKNMGWLWNVGIYGLPHFRRGWRPGAVKKSVAKIMKVHLTPPAEPVACVEPKDPPTLRVQKKDGEYLIVMNPLGDDAELTGNLSPIVFKIMKSEEGKKRSKARKMLKERGVVKTCDCGCIDTCECLTACEKSRIKCELVKVSQEFCLKTELKMCDLKDTSDSEVDVEFTPPSAVKLSDSCGKRKPVKVSYAETQYEVQDNGSVVESDAGGDSKFKKGLKHDVKSVTIVGTSGKTGGKLEKMEGKAGKTEGKTVEVEEKLGKSVKFGEKLGQTGKIKAEKALSRHGKSRTESAAADNRQKYAISKTNSTFNIFNFSFTQGHNQNNSSRENSRRNLH